MSQRAFKIVSWLLGVAGVIAVLWYFGLENIPAILTSIGPVDLVGWVVLTILARIFLVETTVAPLKALGYSLRRSDMFWIGWLRTFANQIFPSAGVIAYTQAIRQKIRISWSELAALAAPQFVLAAAALGCIGLLAIATNMEALRGSSGALLVVYGGVLVGALLISHGAPWIANLLPAALSERLTQTTVALQKFAKRPSLVILVIGCHTATILLRGLRMWLLFAAAGIGLDWREALLVVAVAESSMLIQLTPGGLGVREGAVLVAAMLVGVPTEVAAGVALLDRVLIIAITTLLTPPSIVILRAGTRRN